MDIENFMQWLKTHKLGINMRYDTMGWEHDLGYIKACEVIEAELKRQIQESKEDESEVSG